MALSVLRSVPTRIKAVLNTDLLIWSTGYKRVTLRYLLNRQCPFTVAIVPYTYY